MSIWGKIIGGTAGFALGGPIGAFLGVMVGGSFDRTAKRFTKTNQTSHQHKQSIFALSIIILSAKIANIKITIAGEGENINKYTGKR